LRTGAGPRAINTQARRVARRERRLDINRCNEQYSVMKEASQSQNRGRRATCPEEAAFLDLLRTADILSRRPAQVLKTESLSATQYNVLRILRGAPDGLPCGEIAHRMIPRDPDTPRLVD